VACPAGSLRLARGESVEEPLVASAVCRAERIMRKIDGVFGSSEKRSLASGVRENHCADLCVSRASSGVGRRNIPRLWRVPRIKCRVLAPMTSALGLCPKSEKILFLLVFWKLMRASSVSQNHFQIRLPAECPCILPWSVLFFRRIPAPKTSSAN
jgi:hypothetical protein